MNILHITTFSIGGGASAAAQRHCEAMLRAGENAHILYLEKKKGQQTRIFFTEKIVSSLFYLRMFVF